MYAPVSRQLDAPTSATLAQACAETGSAEVGACQGVARAAPAHYQKASFVQTVQTAPLYPVETGKIESAASSLPMILIAAVLLLIPAVAMGFFGHVRWPGLQRG